MASLRGTDWQNVVYAAAAAAASTCSASRRDERGQAPGAGWHQPANLLMAGPRERASLNAAREDTDGPVEAHAQCGPPFQLQVVFRNGTAEQDAIAAMRKCQGNPLVIRIGRPYRSHLPGSPGQWTAIIYTKQMPAGPAPVPLLTCLRHSPAVTMASWPD